MRHVLADVQFYQKNARLDFLVRSYKAELLARLNRIKPLKPQRYNSSNKTLPHVTPIKGRGGGGASTEPAKCKTEHKSTMNAPKSWANVAETEKVVPAAVKKASPRLNLDTKCAVLDASAIIGGFSIADYAEKLFTTPEVYSEVQDKQSKQVLANLPFGISMQEPSEESIAAGITCRLPSSTYAAQALGVEHKVPLWADLAVSMQH